MSISLIQAVRLFFVLAFSTAIGCLPCFAQPVIKVTASTHVLKLDYSFTVSQPGGNPGTLCAPITGTCTVSNYDGLIITGFYWDQSAPPQQGGVIPGDVYFNQGGTTSTASGYGFFPGNAYSEISCTVTFYDPSTQVSFQESGKDWVIIIGGYVTATQGKLPHQLLGVVYADPGYAYDDDPPVSNPGMKDAAYIEYFGPNNVPDPGSLNPTLPTYAQWPAAGYIGCVSQPDVVTEQFACPGHVKFYQPPQSAGAYIVATAASNTNGDIVPSCTFNLSMIDPFDGKTQINDSCPDCTQHMPHAIQYAFTAHQPVDDKVFRWSFQSLNSPPTYYGIQLTEDMQVTDPLIRADSFPQVYMNEQWTVMVPANSIAVNPADYSNWLTTSQGLFTDRFPIVLDGPYPMYDHPNDPYAYGNQLYWGGTLAIDGSSGILMLSTWFNQFWTDAIIRTKS